MPNAQEAGGVLVENPDTGAMELPESENAAIRDSVLELVENGTALSPLITHIIPGITQTLIPLTIPPMPEVADGIRAGGDGNLSAFSDTWGMFLPSVAQFLNVSIDSPVASKIPPPAGPIIDPTILIKEIKDYIEDVAIPQIKSLLTTVLSEFREHIGDKIAELESMISFSMKDLTVSEVLAGLTEALARIALLPAALAGGFGAALEAINGLLGVFGIPGIDEIIGTIKDTIDQISEIIENLEDLKNKVKENIRNALSSLARTISQEILVGIVDFLIEKFQGLFDLPLPSIPEIPDFILQIPETFSELFNIQPPIINFSLAPPNILSEFFAFFQGILDFFTSQVPTLDFISSLMAALAQGAAGLVEFLIEIVTGIFEEVFDLASGAVVKIATAIVVINRIVRYLAIALVGYLLGNGLIFEGIANELRGV